MIFSSIEYIIFFAVVIILMIVIRSNKAKKMILLMASYFFYAYWDYRFLALMLTLTISNYYLGEIIAQKLNPISRKRWLAASVFLNLSFLGFFKYFNFFLSSANTVLANSGLRLPLLDIILPVGISFMTFEVMSYTIDIYRRNIRPVDSFINLSLLVAFFPHLIAGPILKPSHFIPQLDAEISLSWKNCEKGLQLFLIGLVKKILIADRLALFVDPVFLHPADYSGETLWLAVFAYSFQIYCDFSGYTDMAIGSAKCLGFEIPQTFNMPYISHNISEFWHRWHISLSSWLKEYLYISLGGNKKGNIRTYLNLFIVMLLGGLWHGASWNFVAWGALHGSALAIHKLYCQKNNHPPNYPLISNFLGWFFTFIFVSLAWVFFRTSDINISLYIIEKLFLMVPPIGIHWVPSSLLIISPIMIISHIIGLKYDNIYLSLSTFKGLFLLFFVLLGLLFLMPLNTSPFIYFQF